MSSIAVERRTAPRTPRRNRRAFTLRTVSRSAFAAVLMAGGVVWVGTRAETVYAKPGELLSLPAAVVTPDAATPTPASTLTPGEILLGDATPDLSSPVTRRVAYVLRKFARDERVADRAATALVREASKKNIDPVLLVGLMITENSRIDPLAKSNVGATGLMQVMPFHAGEWGCGSDDLVNVESNICHGVAILADYVRRSPTNLHKALLRYNGCVRGTNTPNCHTYSAKVYKHANQASKLMTALGGDGRTYTAPRAAPVTRVAKGRAAGKAATGKAAAGTAAARKVIFGQIRRTG